MAYLWTGQIETNYDEVTDTFDAMALKQELLRGLWLQPTCGDRS